MNAVEVVVRRVDRFQQRHAVIAFPFAVLQKFGNDQAGGKAVTIAYYGLFSLFPLLLLLSTLLGFVLGNDPSLRQRILASALSNFPVIGPQLRSSTHPLTGSLVALGVGIGGTLYGAQGVGQAALNAMNTIWNVPYKRWPNFWLRRLRGFAVLALAGAATITTTILTGFGSTVLPGGAVTRAWSVAAAVLVDFAVFSLAFIVLTAEPLHWRDVVLGAGLATGFWAGLQSLGGWYVRRELAHATPTYGFFAIVIGLLSWLYLGAELTLLAAEIDVVRRYRLWPRSLTQPPLTEGDKRTFLRLALMEERRPEVEVTAGFTPQADYQPLEE